MELSSDIKSVGPTSASKKKRGSEHPRFSDSARESEWTKQKQFFMEKEDKRRNHKSATDQWEKI